MSLSNIIRPFTSCNKPVIKLVTTTGCSDEIGDSFYGIGDVIDGSSEVSAFPFAKITNLRGFIKDIPRDIIRQVSLNCKPQKVSSTIKYDLQGADAYPAWKMRELEEMFHGKQINIDGYDVQFTGGAMFEQLGKDCPPLFRLRTTIEECRREQIYGCQDECTPNCYFFLIPANIVTQNFFNDAGIQIASNYQQLLDWYGAQSNVQEVQNVVADLQINCDYYRAFKVTATGYLPSFFFFDNPSQVNKVYGMSLDCNQPNYSKLCGNVDNSACGLLVLDPPLVYELTCGDVTITDTTVFMLGTPCDIEPYPNWEQHTGTTNILSSGSLRTINLSVFNEDFVGVAPTDTYYEFITDGTTKCGLVPPIPPDSDVYEIDPVPDGDWSYNPSTQEVTFDPCLEEGLSVKIRYTYGGNAPTLNGEIIAVVSGTGCTPSGPVYLNNSNNASIPVGATLLIEPGGNVRWYGAPTSYDNTGSVIEITNIQYNI